MTRIGPIARSAASPTATAPGAADRSHTKQRILDAAERLFAERGVSGTSLRAVTAAAGVNVAAVHYHFGSKSRLVRALVLRGAGPVNRERLRRLDVLEAAGAPGVEAVLEAWIRPAVEAWEAGGREPMVPFLFSEPVEAVMPLLAEVFGEVSRRTVAALARALPDVEPRRVADRYHLCVGALVHVLCGRFEAARASLAPADAPRPARLDREEVVRLLLDYCACGVRGGP